MTDARRNETTGKPAYETPRIVDHGPVSEMTKTNAAINAVTDGGTSPNIYAS